MEEKRIFKIPIHQKKWWQFWKMNDEKRAKKAIRDFLKKCNDEKNNPISYNEDIIYNFDSDIFIPTKE